MKSFYIIANKIKDAKLEKTKAIAQFLELRGNKCGYASIERVFDDETQGSKVLSRIPKNTDIIISLGGDGTLIQIADLVTDRKTPILGVNMGNLGFLCEVEKDGVFDALDKILNDEYDIDERMMLSGAATISGIRMARVNALNDIVIARRGPLGTASFQVTVNGSELYTCSADGMIVATPTGSTGYNLSAKGPIVAPYSNAIIVTPISAHSLNVQPVVLSDTDDVMIKLVGTSKKKDAYVEVSFDGDKACPMNVGDEVYIKRSNSNTKLVKFNKASFFETLSVKMSDR